MYLNVYLIINVCLHSIFNELDRVINSDAFQITCLVIMWWRVLKKVSQLNVFFQFVAIDCPSFSGATDLLLNKLTAGK